MERVLAQARVYFIIAYGRDRIRYDDKKWVLGRVYFTERRIIFKKLDRVSSILYGDIAEITERDRYSRISPPMGWGRGSILEIKHYENGDKKHVLVTLISADFDVITKMKAIISKLAFGVENRIEEMHKRILLLISLGIRKPGMIRYILGLSESEYGEALGVLKTMGLLTEDMALTSSARKILDELRKSF